MTKNTSKSPYTLKKSRNDKKPKNLKNSKSRHRIIQTSLKKKSVNNSNYSEAFTGSLEASFLKKQNYYRRRQNKTLTSPQKHKRALRDHTPPHQHAQNTLNVQENPDESNLSSHRNTEKMNRSNRSSMGDSSGVAQPLHPRFTHPSNYLKLPKKSANRRNQKNGKKAEKNNLQGEQGRNSSFESKETIKLTKEKSLLDRFTLKHINSQNRRNQSNSDKRRLKKSSSAAHDNNSAAQLSGAESGNQSHQIHPKIKKERKRGFLTSSETQSVDNNHRRIQRRLMNKSVDYIKISAFSRDDSSFRDSSRSKHKNRKKRPKKLKRSESEAVRIGFNRKPPVPEFKINEKLKKRILKKAKKRKQKDKLEGFYEPWEKPPRKPDLPKIDLAEIRREMKEEKLKNRFLAAGPKKEWDNSKSRHVDIGEPEPPQKRALKPRVPTFDLQKLRSDIKIEKKAKKNQKKKLKEKVEKEKKEQENVKKQRMKRLKSMKEERDADRKQRMEKLRKDKERVSSGKKRRLEEQLARTEAEMNAERVRKAEEKARLAREAEEAQQKAQQEKDAEDEKKRLEEEERLEEIRKERDEKERKRKEAKKEKARIKALKIDLGAEDSLEPIPGLVPSLGLELECPHLVDIPVPMNFEYLPEDNKSDWFEGVGQPLDPAEDKQGDEEANDGSLEAVDYGVLTQGLFQYQLTEEAASQRNRVVEMNRRMMRMLDKLRGGTEGGEGAGEAKE